MMFTEIHHGTWAEHVYENGTTDPVSYANWSFLGGVIRTGSPRPINLGIVGDENGSPGGGFNWSGGDLDFRIESDGAPALITIPPDGPEIFAPRRSCRCSYCGSEWYPSKFHPGCCGECGAPR